MTLQEMAQYGLLDELALRIDEPNANIVLAAIGYRSAARPSFTNPLTFWTTICDQIEDGLVGTSNDLQYLVDVAAARYGGNPLFNQYRSPTTAADAGQTPPPRERDFVYLLVQGMPDEEELTLLGRAQDVAAGLGMPRDSVSPEFTNAEGMLLRLENWTSQQALQLAHQLRERAQADNQPVRTSVTTSQFQDYLISRLFIEGPDQARFEIGNVRASTPVGDIAQGVIASEYGSQMFGPDAKGRARRTVIDVVQPDQSTRRLDPDKTLHEEGIGEDDTLNVLPESRAGVHPAIREEALTRARNQVFAYAQSHPGFEVAVNSQQAPTEYLFKFHAPSFAPPQASGGPLLEIEMHEVFLVLPAEFPMKAPEAFWQTPIFHPNVHQEVGKVCLGVLEEHYRPGLDFGELCQILVDIAGYRNYVVEEGYNREAARWAISLEGQEAIENRGGESVIRQVIQEARAPRPLSIKRI